MTPMKNIPYGLTVLVLITIVIALPAVLGLSIQMDKTGTVTSVIDGSTFTLNNGETIKLAEIITPASGEAGFESSRSYLANMIQGKTILLDVDSLIVSDQGEFLCVAYLDYNTTHYENINKAMVENHYAAPMSTHTTEFNPSTWIWFVAKEIATPTPTTIAATPTTNPSASPTPFSGPSPSVTPDISQPTATPTQTTTQPEDTTEQSQTWIIIVAIAGVAAIVVIVLILIKRK